MSEQKFDFPTHLLDLPSKGLVYPKDHPLSKGQIEIKYMTAKEEDILSSQNLIKKGIVIDKLFESIIVDKRVNPDDIVIGDKNAIILATRVLGYGPDYPVEIYSSRKDDIIKTTLDLSSVSTKEVDYSLFENKNEFKFQTPIGKQNITFKILTHGDEKSIDKDLVALQKLNSDTASDITTRLRYMITSVEGDSNIATIGKFVNGLLARDSRALRDYVRSISPDMDMNFTYTHEDGEEEILPITLGVGFFWPTEES